MQSLIQVPKSLKRFLSQSFTNSSHGAKRSKCDKKVTAEESYREFDHNFSLVTSNFTCRTPDEL